MRVLRPILAVAAALVGLGIAVTPGSASADPHWRRGHYDRRPYYYAPPPPRYWHPPPPPVYYAPPPRAYYGPPPVYYAPPPPVYGPPPGPGFYFRF